MEGRMVGRSDLMQGEKWGADMVVYLCRGRGMPRFDVTIYVKSRRRH